MLRPARLAACLLAALACAGSAPQVDFDPGHDFQRARSWDWRPIEQPSGQYMGDLELRDRLGEVVERELAQRGLLRSGRPDLYVTCKLALKRERVLRTETPPVRFVPSLHGDNSTYDVQATVEQIVIYEVAHLAIEISDARSGRVVWTSRADRRVRGRFLDQAEQAVTELLAAFPPPPPPVQAAL